MEGSKGDRRSEKRISVRLPLEIWGRNEVGDLFLDNAIALNISGAGALISEVDQRLRIGDLLGIRYQSRKAQFRIVWMRALDNAERRHVAVQKLPAEDCPWLELLEERSTDRDLIAPDLSHSQQPGGPSLNDPCLRCEHYSTRRWQRYNVDVPVRVIVQTKEKTVLVAGRGTAVSQGGMAVQAGIEIPVGEEIGIEFTPPYSGLPIRIQGMVRNRTGYQYGIEFLTSSTEQMKECERLHLLLASMSSDLVSQSK